MQLAGLKENVWTNTEKRKIQNISCKKIRITAAKHKCHIFDMLISFSMITLTRSALKDGETVRLQQQTTKPDSKPRSLTCRSPFD